MDIDAVFLPVAEELIDDVSPRRSSISKLKTLLTILPRVRRLRTLLSTTSTPASCPADVSSKAESPKSMNEAMDSPWLSRFASAATDV